MNNETSPSSNVEKLAKKYADKVVGDPDKFNIPKQDEEHEICMRDFLAGYAAATPSRPQWVQASKKPDEVGNYYVKTDTDFRLICIFANGKFILPPIYEAENYRVTEWLDENTNS